MMATLLDETKGVRGWSYDRTIDILHEMRRHQQTNWMAPIRRPPGRSSSLLQHRYKAPRV